MIALFLFALFLFIILFLSLFIIIGIKLPHIKGAAGEKKVSLELNFLGKDFAVLNNLLLPNGKGGTSQIDHVVLSEFGIFVIETKNYSGWIFGNEKSEYWMQVLFKEKHKFRNPVKQNWSHVYALKAVLKGFSQAKYFPIVVFAGNAELKQIESSVPVIYDFSLKDEIKNLCEEKCLSEEDVLKIKSVLESNEIVGNSAMKNHVKGICREISKAKENLENLVCPKCNAPLKLRSGKYGEFYGCTNYPQCKFTRKI